MEKVPNSFFKFEAEKSADLQDRAFLEGVPCTDHELLQALADGSLIVSEGPIKTPKQWEAEKWDAGKERRGLIGNLRALVSRRR